MLFVVKGDWMMKKERIVVKIGSSSLTSPTGEIDYAKMKEHVGALAQLKRLGHEVILVSSGAVAAGFKQLNYAIRPVTTKGKQAAAAVGQGLLIQTYNELFQNEQLLPPAQLLLTRQDFSHRETYEHIFSTMTELLERGVIPIVNENDTVAVDELTFGDNDMLSALVAGMIHAERLIILTDINGIYSANPRTDPEAEKFDTIHTIDEQLLGMADSKGSSVGTGGMTSKLLAARRAQKLGVEVFIGSGVGEDKLVNILKGNGDGTYVLLDENKPMTTKRQWVALHSDVAGELHVDEGAERAIVHRGKSLLPAGITRIVGHFEEGDVVDVYAGGNRIGKGVVQYSEEALREAILRRERLEHTDPMKEVIHRDQWVDRGGIDNDE